MHITKSQIEQTTILVIDGEVNFNSSPELKKVFDELLKKGAQKFIIDFTKISYIDSSGLATMLEVLQRLKPSKGSLSLINISVKIKNVFHVTKLDSFFPMYNSLDEALASLN